VIKNEKISDGIDSPYTVKLTGLMTQMQAVVEHLAVTTL
jgi:hypothetical protein